MPVSTIDDGTRNAALDGANAELNDGGGANATYEFGDATFANIYIIWNMDATTPFVAAGSATQGEAELTGAPLSAVAIATGTATNYRVKDKAGTVRRSGTLATPLSVTTGATYNLSAPSNQPAS